MNDAELIAVIRNKEPRPALQELYSHFPKVRALIRHKGGNAQDAADVFQESLIIFCKKVSDPSFQLTASAGTYLYSVCWHLWKDMLQKRNRESRLSPWPEATMNVQEEVHEHQDKEKKFGYLDQILDQLGDKCKAIFQLYYYRKQSMDEIARVLNYGSEQSAKNQKYKCMEKARELAKAITLHS